MESYAIDDLIRRVPSWLGNHQKEAQGQGTLLWLPPVVRSYPAGGPRLELPILASSLRRDVLEFCCLTHPLHWTHSSLDPPFSLSLSLVISYST